MTNQDNKVNDEESIAQLMTKLLAQVCDGLNFISETEILDNRLVHQELLEAQKMKEVDESIRELLDEVVDLVEFMNDYDSDDERIEKMDLVGTVPQVGIASGNGDLTEPSGLEEQKTSLSSVNKACEDHPLEKEPEGRAELQTASFQGMASCLERKEEGDHVLPAPEEEKKLFLHHCESCSETTASESSLLVSRGSVSEEAEMNDEADASIWEEEEFPNDPDVDRGSSSALHPVIPPSYPNLSQDSLESGVCHSSEIKSDHSCTQPNLAGGDAPPCKRLKLEPQEDTHGQEDPPPHGPAMPCSPTRSSLLTFLVKKSSSDSDHDKEDDDEEEEDEEPPFSSYGIPRIRPVIFPGARISAVGLSRSLRIRSPLHPRIHN